MVTYKKDLETPGWHRSGPIRATLVVAGILLVLVGMAGWAIETEYGGDPNQPEYIIGWDNEGGHAFVLEGEEGPLAYEATDLADAEAWIESQRGSRDYLIPILLIVGGSILLVAGIAPSPRRDTRQPTQPLHDHPQPTRRAE